MAKEELTLRERLLLQKFMQAQEQQQQTPYGGDIAGKEDELAAQTLLADQLRQSGTRTAVSGGGVGGNIGRAAYGIGAAVKDYRNAGMMKDLNAARVDSYSKQEAMRQAEAARKAELVAQASRRPPPAMLPDIPEPQY
jgi:hypothetical protein